jgi:hypothetical protein
LIYKKEGVNLCERRIKATLTIECDVLIDDLVKRNAEKECNATLSDREIAEKLLYAFLNPKIDNLNDPELVNGSWDRVCEFGGRLEDFELIE